MKMIDMTCPKCGAVMKIDADKEKALCEYCGALFLIEQEDTLEEIQAKAEARAYGYHKGRLRAEASATVKEKKQSKMKIPVPVVVFAVILLIGVLPVMVEHFSKPQVNPFECIEVSFRGTDGEGEILIEITGAVPGIDANLIEYEISKDRHLLQGETVSIEADSSDYRLTQKTMMYTVEGLDEYLKDLEDLPEDALSLIHTQSEDVLEINLDSTESAGYFVDMKPVKMFLITDGKQANILYDVFEVRFVVDGAEENYYVTAGFEDVILRSGGQSPVNMSYGMYYGHLTQVQGAIFIMAYDSLEDIRNELLLNMESYLELKEMDL